MTVESALKQYINLDFTKEETASIQKAAETKDTVKIDDAIEESDHQYKITYRLDNFWSYR
ncbi:hypothetical protein BsIDN1_17640 [Bacillus safensis]|uniref:Uncharacterized protein n=1 Tax=Bacillus safensis TaxID=561879 RepID=A0A5S9M9C5_BACIA|nr:hypothetical protein BsIDN1_17640 [Bacillus safensis]